jgi:hypothetical protein
VLVGPDQIARLLGQAEFLTGGSALRALFWGSVPFMYITTDTAHPLLGFSSCLFYLNELVTAGPTLWTLLRWGIPFMNITANAANPLFHQ